MDEEKKKKKRNNKKKNKQSKTVEDSTVGVPETASPDDNHMSNGHSFHNQMSDTTVVRNDAMGNSDVNLNNHQPDGSKSVLAEKEHWLLREAALEGTIERLHEENSLHIQKQFTLEDTIKQLKEENDSHIQKQLTLENTINQLQEGKDSHIQKEASLQMKIAELKNEKDSWFLKEARLQEKINYLVDENTTLDSKGTSLMETIKHLESEKDSWILKESSIKDTNMGLNDNITRLQAQVVELEESKHNLLQENKQLKEDASDLHSRIQNLEQRISSPQSSEEVIKDLNSQVEAACVLVEKLITENAELVEKVNELYADVQQMSTKDTLSRPSLQSDQIVRTTDTASIVDHVSESAKLNTSVPDQKLEAIESVQIRDNKSDSDDVRGVEHPSAALNSLVSDKGGEIVQIPLDDNEIRNLELQNAEPEDEVKVAVPLSDAPLVGAPFRLISFVAKYVSGADLVDKTSSVLS